MESSIKFILFWNIRRGSGKYSTRENHVLVLATLSTFIDSRTFQIILSSRKIYARSLSYVKVLRTIILENKFNTLSPSRSFL